MRLFQQLQTMQIIPFEKEIVRFSRRCRDFLILIFRENRDMRPHLHIDGLFMSLPYQTIFFLIQSIFDFVDRHEYLVIISVFCFQLIQKRQHALPLLLG